MASTLLYSGGLDSLMLWRLAQPEFSVYVQVGAAYEADELATVRRLQDMVAGLRVHVVQGPTWLGDLEQADGHIPLRNLVLATTAAAWTPAVDQVLLGAVRGESSPDKSRAFVRSASRALSRAAGHRVQLRAPLRRHSKAWWLAQHLARWPQDREALLATHSCYEPGQPDGVAGCGCCMACFRRWVATSLAGLPEPYVNDPAERMLAGAIPGSRPGLGALRRTPVREWPAFLGNQLVAYRALRARR